MDICEIHIELVTIAALCACERCVYSTIVQFPRARARAHSCSDLVAVRHTHAPAYMSTACPAESILIQLDSLERGARACRRVRHVHRVRCCVFFLMQITIEVSSRPPRRQRRQFLMLHTRTHTARLLFGFAYLCTHVCPALSRHTRGQRSARGVNAQY